MRLITISTSFDMTGADLVEVIFSQKGKTIVDKKGSDVIVDDDSVQVALSNAEIELLEPGRYVPIEVRAYYDEGTMLKSNVMYRPFNQSTERDFSMNSDVGDVSILINNTEADRIWDELDDKVDKEEGKGLSSNDYTSADKTKLAGIEAGAEVNVKSDWDEASPSKDEYIDNKPSALTSAEINGIIDSLS